MIKIVIIIITSRQLKLITIMFANVKVKERYWKWQYPDASFDKLQVYYVFMTKCGIPFLAEILNMIEIVSSSSGNRKSKTVGGYS